MAHILVSVEACNDYMAYENIIWTFLMLFIRLSFSASLAKVGWLRAESNCVRHTDTMFLVNNVPCIKM